MIYVKLADYGGIANATDAPVAVKDNLRIDILYELVALAGSAI